MCVCVCVCVSVCVQYVLFTYFSKLSEAEIFNTINSSLKIQHSTGIRIAFCFCFYKNYYYYHLLMFLFLFFIFYNNNI